ncbi:MAG: hypothetical protein J3R72DRAFT_446964 [Linnemannia gamsii]|nr:MAG: hypothetical protein J3R72DRAFT_446964 [Linnemannia gamsii]
MPNSAVHANFAIPELALLVSAHLTRSDLARCILVSNDWSRLFEPILWTNLCLTQRYAHSYSDVDLTPAITAALKRNLSHIRSVTVYFHQATLLQELAYGLRPQSGDSAEDPSTLCTNLRRLEMKDIYYRSLHLFKPHLVTLLDHNHRLTHLFLPFEFIRERKVPAAISKLRSLQHLSIYSIDGCARSREMLPLLQACLPLPELTELLFMDMDVDWDENDKNMDMSDPETIIREASIARFSQNRKAARIKSLSLARNRSGTRNPLPLLLLKSNLLDLESCEIPWFPPDADFEEVEQVVREHCPNLNHVTCPSPEDDERNCQFICAFIRGCSRLQSFASDYFCDDDSKYYILEPQFIISEVVLHHYNTLEVIELTNCYRVYSRDQQAILSRCKRLKRFWVECNRDKGNAGISSTDISRSDWVCRELRELSLTLNRCPKEEDSFGDLEEEQEQEEEEEQKEEEQEKEEAEETEEEHDPNAQLVAIAVKNIYTQIGQLERLEVLALDIDRSCDTMAKEGDYAWDLTVSNGWLGEMAGLKNLKTLRLKADFWSMMGQAEVEFIHERWPLLSEISIPRNALQLLEHSHWQWLLNKRPELRVTVVPGYY